MCLWVTIAVVVLAAVVALSFIYLPTWGALLVLVGLLLVFAMSFKWIMGKVAERFFMGIFDMKSRALRDADAVIHSVKPASAPARDADMELVDEDGEKDGATDEDEANDPARMVIREYYTVEATITPKPVSGKGFHMWDIDDLTMVPYEMKVTKSADDDADDDTCEIRQVLVQEDGRYQDLEQSKLEGPHRLEFLVGVKPGHRRLKFRYYFESFGDIRLP
jgi:hypothetical protein